MQAPMAQGRGEVKKNVENVLPITFLLQTPFNSYR